mmetsp:Transcript_11073/g.23657  ORF Transcript_11073/g.23657 Transcript_11073/m.23657 type:complete len:308 (+) Transcript_11073:407-1330(+)
MEARFNASDNYSGMATYPRADSEHSAYDGHTHSESGAGYGGAYSYEPEVDDGGVSVGSGGASALSAVAVESDGFALTLTLKAAAALRNLSTDERKADGVRLVKQALFDVEEMRERASSKGVTLTSADELPLPMIIYGYLRFYGILWAEEQAEAARLAAAHGAPVLCLRGGQRDSALATRTGADAPPTPPKDPSASGLVSAAAIWLNLRARTPYADHRSCDVEHVEAVNDAMRRFQPLFYAAAVESTDDLFAQRLGSLCDVLAAQQASGDVSDTSDELLVVAVIGAQHVAGVRRRIQQRDRSEFVETG